jgi:16S rRNA (adenine(1408)-N(1))-methyltransferase
MAESSRRAARTIDKGGLPNLLFVVAAAEAPPDLLRGHADEVLIVFPWGSLLRGALALDEATAAGIAALVAPGGVVRGFVSITDRDTATTDLRPLTALDANAIARRWSDHGLTLTCFEPAGAKAIDATGSTWGRRLTAGRRRGGNGQAQTTERPVWTLELQRDSGHAGPPG